jgi:hypothetical protein
MSKEMLSALQICEGFLPVDMAAGANTGDYVSLKHYRRCLVVLFADPGTASEDPVLTLQQAQDASGTGAKALDFTTIHQKEAGTNLQGTGAYTRVTQAAANTYTSATGGENAQLIVVEVAAEDLDVAGAFDFIRATVADTGATAGKMGALLYILGDPVIAARPDHLVSAIA